MALYTTKIPLEPIAAITQPNTPQNPSPSFPDCPEKATADVSAAVKTLEKELELAAEKLENSEATRMEAEAEVVKLKNDQREITVKFQTEETKLKTEIATKNAQLKKNTKRHEQDQSLRKSEQEKSEKNTQILKNKISNLLSKNDHLQKKIEEIKEDQTGGTLS